MTVLKYLALFLTSVLVAMIGVVGYFKITQKVSKLSIPSLPSISLSDLVKLTRFSLDKAPSESLVGSITGMVGDVEYEPRLATESAKIFSPKDVQQGESLTTGEDGEVTLTFTKTLEIKLFASTTVSVIQTLPVDLVFTQKTGRANYTKLSSGPVSIRSLHLLIENGGGVSVSVDKEKPVVTVEVISGVTKVAYNNTNNDTQYVEIESGKKLTFNDDTRRVTVE